MPIGMDCAKGNLWFVSFSHAEYIVIWKRKEDEKEYRVVLPRIELQKKLKNIMCSKGTPITPATFHRRCRQCLSLCNNPPPLW